MTESFKVSYSETSNYLSLPAGNNTSLLHGTARKHACNNITKDYKHCSFNLAALFNSEKLAY